MATLPLSASVMQGDFLDGVVESTLRGVVSQLKAEYQKELKMALAAASQEPAGASEACAEGADLASPSELAVPLNTPVTPVAELGGAQAAVKRPGLAAPAAGPPAAAAAARASAVGARLLVAPEREAWSEGERQSLRAGKRSQHSAVWPDKPARASKFADKWQGKLTDQDQDVVKSLREEAVAREEAVLANRVLASGSRASTVEPPPLTGAPSPVKDLSYRIISSSSFDFSMGLIIMLNAITIGVETSIARDGSVIPVGLHVLEYTFLLIYCVELATRLYVSGMMGALSNNWVKFDAVMVVTGTLNLFLTLTTVGGDAASSVVDNANMLKMLRLFRLAKTVRVFVQFRTLWMLIQGLMYAVLPMFWTAIIMGVVIYVFAIIAMELIVPSSADDDPSRVARKYDTIGDAMMTLLQFMTLDSISSVYRPLVETKPWLMTYFLIFILIGPIACMNIVIQTAIMVESALRTANEDQEAKKAWDAMRRKTMMPKLRSMFMAMDTSGDGEVELEEVINSPPEIKEALQHIVGLEELEEVFSLMDYDGSGSIDIEEFVDGIMRSNSDKPSELFVLVKQGKVILERLKYLKMQAGAPNLRFAADGQEPAETNADAWNRLCTS
ncbi:unnamed protein product [Prorocentrum cordatum]|uniref:EF-hand domain-containing protein n=1 Tax=Prorocentrum cordatum TaxID=2364126 RepID=A0ABN9XFG9_9DINO|nr:unnamed protein product [Polarella glacialis]